MKKSQTTGLVLFLSAALVFSACSSMKNSVKGGLIGGGSGAAVGAGIGALIGKGKGALIGSAIGAAVGGTAGALIGNKMDKQKAELERINNLKVEEVLDANDLKAIKVTFPDGILFATGKSVLSTVSRNELNQFAQSLLSNPGTDITVCGFTDSTGSRSLNDKLSLDRAQAVADYLINHGVSSSRISTRGFGPEYPVADNATPAGRSLNRRVEIYITAGKEMIRQAEAGTLN